MRIHTPRCASTVRLPVALHCECINVMYYGYYYIMIDNVPVNMIDIIK